MLGRPFGEAAEPVGGVGGRPAAGRREPPGRGEVAVGHDRGDPVLEAGADHPPVVVEGGPGEGARLGLDPGPLEGEAVRVEPQVGHRGDVLGVPVVVVTGVEGGLGEQRVLGPLQGPEVGVHVAALDLVPGRGRAPQEPVGKGRHGPRIALRGEFCKPLQTVLDPDRLLPADPGVRRIARALLERTRSLPIISPHGHLRPRLPSPTTVRSATRPPSWSPGTTTCCGCSTARGCRSRRSGVVAPRRRRPRSPTGAAPGARSPSTTPSSGRPRRSCGSTTRCRRSSASPSRCRRPPPMPSTTTSSSALADRRLPAPGPLRALRHRVPGHHRRRPRPPRRPRHDRGERLGAAGSCPRSGPTTSSTPTARTSRTTSAAWAT